MALTAYTHIQLWRLAVLPALDLIPHSGWLFYHQNVHVIDVIVANVLMKSVSIFVSFIIVAAVCILFRIIPPIRDPGLVLAAWGLDTLFCFSFAVFMAGIAALSEIVEKLMHPAMYLTLPITGAFTLTTWVPPRMRVILEWVPLANCCEMFRAGIFPLSVKTYWSVPLIVISSVFFLAVGFPITEYARRRVDVTAA